MAEIAKIGQNPAWKPHICPEFGPESPKIGLRRLKSMRDLWNHGTTEPRNHGTTDLHFSLHTQVKT